MDAARNYPGIVQLRRFNLRLTEKADGLKHAAPCLGLWLIIVFLESLIGVLAIIMFLCVMTFAATCIVFLSVGVFIAWLLKIAGFPKAYNVLWVEKAQPSISPSPFI